jgi:hypothetical protein
LGLISITNVSDGNTATAADVNTPLNTIVTAINGNLDANNLSNNAVSTAKLQDAAVTATKLGLAPSTYTSSGTGGGTGYYVNLGGIKICWGTTGTLGPASGYTTCTISLPTGFFSAIQSYNVSLSSIATTQDQRITGNSAPSTSTISYYWYSSTPATSSVSWLVIGS